ncbi:MAG: DNA-3-methyladenine glycosylase 2 family protein [Actinomycetota bacterium]|nr:DNA-3-methyladenine glycosylase 2 family protein [Actinomycetota bacterium]
MRFTPTGIWRATRTPLGAATTQIQVNHGALTMRAWGPGAEWAIDNFPALVGALDEVDAFVPRDPIVAELHRRMRGLRIGRSGAVTEALVPTIIEQKVVGIDAKRAYARMVRALGEPAPPAPVALTLPPEPGVLARTPSWAFHRFNIERRRADTVRRACSYAPRLEETARMPTADAYQRLTALPGVGTWTAAEVAVVALGDADAVSVGDYHLPHQVAFALAGEHRADDARMLELLEPYRGQRARVIRLVVAGASSPPRFGPRMPLRSIATI